MSFPRFLIFIALSTAFLPVTVTAQESVLDFLQIREDPALGSLMIQLDNDLFAGSDRDYTNGFRIAMGGPSGLEPNYGGIREWLRKLSGDESGYSIFDHLSHFEDEKPDYSWGFSLTQLMYTPDNPVPPTPPLGERPYAAWLGAEFSMQVRDENSLSTVALALGVTGQWALGEEVQDIVHHDISKSPYFNGWKSQLPEEVTISLILDHKRRIQFFDKLKYGCWGIDGYYEFGGSLGTLRTEAYIGTLVRAGWNLPGSYVVPRIQFASYGNQYFKGADQNNDFRAYVMAGARASLVAHDATLDGSLFQDWRYSVGSKPFVGEFILGCGVGICCFDLIYSRVIRSDEFKGQLTNQEYGSVQLVWQKQF